MARSDTEVTLLWQFSVHGEVLDVLRAQLAARLHTEKGQGINSGIKAQGRGSKIKPSPTVLVSSLFSTNQDG